jgi:hypothetical protein
MRRSAVCLVAAAVLAACSACSDGGNERSAEVDYIADFVYYGVLYVGDAPLGQVGIERRGSRTRVALTFPDSTRLEADIRRGSCVGVDAIGRRVVATLEPLIDGRSETLVELSVNELRSRDYLVVVREPGGLSPAQRTIACSGLARARRG